MSTVQDINNLYEGVTMKILNNEEMTISGKVIACLVDTLAQYLRVDFKEGVGG